MFKILSVLALALPSVLLGGPMYSVQDLGATAVNTLVIGLGLSSNAAYATGSQNPSWLWSSGGGIVSLTVSTGVAWQEARGVNASGQVVGYSDSVSPGGQQALWWDGVTLKTFKPAGASFAQAWGINDAGLVIGFAQISGQIRVFAWNPATNASTVYTGTAGTALGISPNGTAVGYSVAGASDQAMRFDGGLSGLTGILLDNPAGAAFSRALGVNDASVAVGYGNVSGVDRAVVWTGTTAALLPILAASASGHRASGINNAGDIVGQSVGRAVLWRGGLVYDLNALITNPISGLNLDAGMALAENGSILATGTLNGRYRSFLLTPLADIPEPSTWTLAGGAFTALFLRRRGLRRD